MKIGDIVTVSGYAGSPTTCAGRSLRPAPTVKLGESDFHVSCSDVNMDGETEDPSFPNDCGRPEGDAKGLTGFLNDWIFAGHGRSQRQGHVHAAVARTGRTPA